MMPNVIEMTQRASGIQDTGRDSSQPDFQERIGFESIRRESRRQTLRDYRNHNRRTTG